MIQNLEKHYKALGLEPGASLEEVNQAYKDLVFIWHPDRLPQENERLIQKSVEKLQQINEARDFLRSYHRTHKKEAAARPAKTKSYYSSPYYSNGSSYSRPKSESYSAKNKHPYTQQRQQTYSRPNYRDSYQQARPWEYNTYYSSSNQTRDRQTSSRDSYRDFSESEKSRSRTNSTPATDNSCKRPYYKDLRGANLSRSNFKERDFSCRDMSQADLSYADLSDTFLHKIILEEANLEGANLKGANLLQANLRGANLREVNLIGADLSGSDLSGADLTGAKVGFQNKIMVKITAVKLTGATLPDGSIHP